MSLTEEAKRNILVSEFLLAFSLEAGRCQGMAIQTVLIKAKNQGFQGLELLAEAIKKVGLINPIKIQDQSTKNSGTLKCSLCNKGFAKGVSGWRGYKRICTQNCTEQHLR